MALELSEQELFRRNSLQELYKLGVDPYPAESYAVNATAKEILEHFQSDTSQYQEVSLAGRIMTRRIMGAASFVDLQDASGRIQLYIKRDDICLEEDKTLYNTIFKRLMDIGDIIGVTGYVFITQMGEISIHVKGLKLLSKSVKPLPIVKEAEGQTFDAVTDPEFKYRQRYVDLIVNPAVKDVFVKRTRMINIIRDFLNQQGALEVDTPVLQSIPGGAAARPFITHHNALDIPLYLRIANELYLKRLIVGGFDWVYEFSRDFRNEGMDRTHNPEFTILEFYVAYRDYFWMMEQTEQMLEKIALGLHGTTEIPVGDKTISFKAPFKRISIYDAIHEHTGFDISAMDETALRDVCSKLGIEADATMGKGKIVDAIFGEKAEHHYIQPTFIIDYPTEMSPLTKKHRSKAGLVERFELMINGKEIANAYSELNDPIDQRERFEDQIKLMERGDHEAMFIDYDFLRALEYGMPPTAGIGIGIDRLAMLMTNQASIQDVLFFPQMRPEKKIAVNLASDEDFMALGIPAEWVPVVRKAGFKSPEEVKAANPNKLLHELSGLRKKLKLEIPSLKLEEIQAWVNA
ncbi:MAG: lysine--tRNA ligase [Bacteroidales bacterium]|nr:lysine--tRNA ligase [Bacteroidales bacterium]